jgi:uncharacterized protein
MMTLDALTLPTPGAPSPTRLRTTRGVVEIAWTLPKTPPCGLALVAHPHPLFGGALSNKVTYTLASQLARGGYAALRFNFRGVGASEGVHDAGIGETDDAEALARALQALAPRRPLLLLGFSFGAFIQLRVAERLPVAGVLTVAPPMRKYLDLPLPGRPAAPWWWMHSRDDEVVDYAETAETMETYNPRPEARIVDGAGHFFHGKLDLVQQTVDAFLSAVTAAGSHDAP